MNNHKLIDLLVYATQKKQPDVAAVLGIKTHRMLSQWRSGNDYGYRDINNDDVSKIIKMIPIGTRFTIDPQNDLERRIVIRAWCCVNKVKISREGGTVAKLLRRCEVSPRTYDIFVSRRGILRCEDTLLLIKRAQEAMLCYEK